MRSRRSPAASRDRASSEEGSLSQVTFVGSFPNPKFRLDPTLPEIAFVGRSNVGKSTLINALLGRKALARTSKTPGKTRDCNVYSVGDRLYLVDLPGYGYARVSHDERRRLGRLIEGYLRNREPLAGVVWLLDIRRDPNEQDRALAELLARRGTPVLVAMTKGDKVTRSRQIERASAILEPLPLSGDQIIVTSAQTRQGIDDLRDSVLALVEPAA